MVKKNLSISLIVNADSRLVVATLTVSRTYADWVAKISRVANYGQHNNLYYKKLKCRRCRHRCVCTVNSTYVAISVWHSTLLSKNLFPTSSLMQEREKSSTDKLHSKIRRRVFFVLRVAQVKKAKDLFSDKLHTRAHTWKPLSPPGLVCRQKRGTWERKEEDQRNSLYYRFIWY